MAILADLGKRSRLKIESSHEFRVGLLAMRVSTEGRVRPANRTNAGVLPRWHVGEVTILQLSKGLATLLKGGAGIRAVCHLGHDSAVARIIDLIPHDGDWRGVNAPVEVGGTFYMPSRRALMTEGSGYDFSDKAHQSG